jgi:hypothetical protein
VAADRPLCAERMRAVLTSPDLKAADAVYLHDHWGGDDRAGLADMIGRIRSVTDVPIYVFGPKMTFRTDVLVISKEAQARRRATVGAINTYAAAFQQTERVSQDQALSDFFRAQRFADTHYISTLQVQCGAAKACDILSPQGGYLYFDAGHFTLDGARRFGARLKAAHPELFDSAAAPGQRRTS